MSLAYKLRFVFFVSFYLLIHKSNAQYANIPDGNFVQWLANSSVANCLVGTQIDTTCQALQDDTIINCSGAQIKNLEGIQFFRNLRYLDCSANLHDSLVQLPPLLRQLICYNNKLQYIKVLPDSLTYFT